MNEYLKRLYKMINKVNRIKDNNKKREFIYDLSSYASFIFYSGYITAEQFNNAIRKVPIDFCEEKYQEEKNLSINNLIANNERLNTFYQDMLSIYQKYEIEKKPILDNSINLEKHFVEFLKYMNCYDLFQNLERKGMISYTSPILNYSICIGNRKDSYIVVNENDDFYRYITLSHEMAHAYENHILNKRKQFFDVPWQAEILSTTFNRIFMEYLYQNNVISHLEAKTLKNNFEVNCWHFLNWTHLITEAIKHNAYTIDDYDINLYLTDAIITRSLTDHNYSLGSMFSHSMYEKWLRSDKEFIHELPQIIFYIDKMELKELVDFFHNTNIVEKELDKVLIKK